MSGALETPDASSLGGAERGAKALTRREGRPVRREEALVRATQLACVLAAAEARGGRIVVEHAAGDWDAGRRW